MDRRGRAIGLGLTGCLVLLLLLLVSGCGGGPEDATAATTTTTTELVVPLRNSTCLSCHKDFEQVTAREDQRKFSHALHLQQRLDCVTCHSAVGHAGAVLPPQSLCNNCHGLTMPHPAGYQKSHGKIVLKQGDALCARCHNVYLHCQECHGVQMPHPDNWKQKHGTIAQPEMQTCATCHPKTFCLSCHPVEMPHPKDWTAKHGLTVNDKGSRTCTMCHKASDCTACHGLPMPHPQDWGTAHPKAAAKDRAGCMLCHDQKDCDLCHEIHKTHGKGGGA